MLQAQFSRNLKVWQICYEIAEKGSKIVPLGAPFFIMFHVYVLRSETTGRHYVGYTSDLTQRLGQHNHGITKSTKDRGPWRMLHDEDFNTRPEAVRRERFLKTGQGREELKRILASAGTSAG
jgi:putative endonuclease